MEQRLSMITLGSSDLDRSRAFYEALGWTTRSEQGGGDPIFFQAGGMVVALWDRAKLAEDSMVTDGGGWGGMTLAFCTRSREQVDEITEQARAAGATIGREPAETFWGGYDSIVIDPDGHPWEIAHNARWTIEEDGSLRIPED
jgi:predicted lactoylglutathione lyase